MITFSEDRVRGPIPGNPSQPLVCPDSLDAMLQIVFNCSRSRMDVLRDNQVAAAQRHVDAQDDSTESPHNSEYPSVDLSVMTLLR